MRASAILIGGLLAAWVWAQQDSAQVPTTEKRIPGYTYGTASVPKAPITLAELELLKKTVLLGDEDVRYLRMSRKILEPQIEEILDVWYGFVGSNDHLLKYFTNKSDGKPNADYLGAVRKRFGQWILDTAAADFDQKWLDYQFEIGRRHHRSGKNRTDGVEAVDHIPYRYLPALAIPITTTLKPFLANSGAAPEDVEKMHAAWVKAVTLQTILWSYPYVRDGDW
ncbi:MAG: protogloblin ApPgb [Planctomycetota bacterium]|nr:MAG: protogloblin ApPgb [Planctomycetota bacterium]